MHEIDSLEFLKKFKKKDKIMYISNASHDPIFELNEYNLIKNNLDKGSIIISDNGSQMISKFSIQEEKKLICFTEEVENHWYPGAKCCVCYGF